MLNREQCAALHQTNNGKRCWLENLAENDHRLVLLNDDKLLYTFMSSEFDKEQQAQAARLCAAINSERHLHKRPRDAEGR